MKQFKRLEEYCDLNKLKYDEECNNKFDLYYELLVETNKVMNLTAITDREEVELKHFIDSLAAAAYLKESADNWKRINEKDLPADHNNEGRYQIVDIGTGAGFPGLPLSFMLPEVEFTLADSLNKRISFIQSVVSKLDLKNVSAIHGRAEELGHGNLRESFDCCVSRAVADMPVLLEYCMPMVKLSGIVILYKAGEIREELERAEYAMRELGGILLEVNNFQLYGSDISRSLIIIKKSGNTPSKYPRKAGKPVKQPLMKSHS